MVFYWSLSDSKSLQISRTLLSILAKLNNDVVCKDLILPLISTFSIFFPQVFVKCFKHTNWYHHHCHVSHHFFSSLARSKYLSVFSCSFIFTQWSTQTAESTRWQVLFLMLLKSWFGLLVELGDLFVLQNFREFYVSQFPGRILLCAYTIR